MIRIGCIVVPFILSGCLAVIGYEPTPEEVAAIQRGEDPRTNEQPRESAGGENTENRQPAPAPGPQLAGPHEGIVLRWMDSATLVIEANDKREVVTLVGEAPRADSWDEQKALDERMNQCTYGKAVRLKYPQRSKAGDTIYRDREGRLLAIIE